MAIHRSTENSTAKEPPRGEQATAHVEPVMLRSWWCVREIASEKGLLDSWVLFRNDQVGSGGPVVFRPGPGTWWLRATDNRKQEVCERASFPDCLLN